MEYGLALRWLLGYVALSLLALPAAAALFDRFPDRGSGLALPLSLATLGVVGYWVGHVSYGLPAALAGVVVLFGVSVLALGWGVEPDLRRHGETLLVFGLAFLLVVGVRAVDPAVSPLGGEKFLDFGLLKSLARTEQLPPEDMWFAGEPVQYYYGGHMIAALLAEVLFTAPRYAYNLALAGFYGALVSAAYGLAGAIAASRDRPRLPAAVAGAVFVGFASNLATPLRFLAWLLPGDLGLELAAWMGVEPKWIAGGPGEFYYWWASRVIPGTINEFPLFAFLNGDLHAHMMSTPLLLVVAGLLLAYWQTPARNRRRRRALVFGVVAPIGGLIAVVNTWSFPSVGGLVVLTVLFASGHPADLLPAPLGDRLRGLGAAGGRGRSSSAATDGGTAEESTDARQAETAESSTGDPPENALGAIEWDRLRAEAVRTASALAVGVATTGLAVVASLPFWTGTASTRSIGVLPTRSGFGGLLVVHGVFLAITAAYLRGGLDRDFDPVRLLVWVAALVVVAALYDLAVLALVVPPLLVAWVLLRRGRLGYEAVLFVGAAGLVTIVEFVFIEEQAGPERLNTVFKVYMQVWVLWATAAGVMLSEVTPLSRIGAALSGAVGAHSSDRDGSEASGGGGLAAVLTVLLVVSVSMYGAFALAAHFDDADDPTLDATRFVDRHHTAEATAIAWIDGREGQPTIVSAPSPYQYRYRWSNDRQLAAGGTVYGGNAPSSLTGVPTVAGWAHEIGYRGAEPYRERVDDVNTIFAGADPEVQAALLEQYDVRYVYVGPAERDRYDEITVTDLPGVRPVHESGRVTVYTVDHDRLPG